MPLLPLLWFPACKAVDSKFALTSPASVLATFSYSAVFDASGYTV